MQISIMKKLLLLSSLLLPILCSSQELVSSAGQSSSSSNLNAEWSLGEIVIQEANLNSNIITQGLHQPKYAPSGHEDLEDIKVEVFPNPFSQRVTIRSSSNTLYHGSIYNPIGQVVKRFELMKESALDLSQLGALYYMIQLINSDNQSVKEFKLIKSH